MPADRERHPITRISLDEGLLRTDQEAFEQHLYRQASELAREFEIPELRFEQREVDRAEVEKKVADLSRLFHFDLSPVLKLELFPGLQLINPLYDVSWNVGSGMPLSHWDGKPMVFGGNGFSGSGFGVNLTTSKHVTVSAIPWGQFKAGWVNFDPPSALRSAGGTGAVVYADGNLVLSREPRVWDVRSPGQYTSGNWDQPYGSTATPPLTGSFGTVPLAPVLFDMLPGKRYQLWFWVWHLNEAIEGKSFIAFASADIPAIAITVSDPLFIH